MLRLPKQDTELIIKYLKEKYPGHYDELTIDELEKQPYNKRIWLWWQSLAYYGHKGTYFTRLEDAPDGLEWITVMGSKGPKKDYKWRNGKYEFIQEMSEKTCKAIYRE